jgi:hypothetical protein
MWGTGRECPWQVRGTTFVVSGMAEERVVGRGVRDAAVRMRRRVGFWSWCFGVLVSSRSGEVEVAVEIGDEACDLV